MNTARSTAEKEGVKLPKEISTWASDLSEENQEAMIIYGSGNYRKLNSALRNCGPGVECLGEYYESVHKYLSDAIHKSPRFAEPVTAYRGMRIADTEGAAEFMRQIEGARESGKPVTMKGITSMSLSPRVAEQFINQEHGTEGQAVLVRIKAYSGAFISAVAGPSALELAHDHGQKYRVVSSGRDSSGRYVVEMEQED